LLLSPFLNRLKRASTLYYIKYKGLSLILKQIRIIINCFPLTLKFNNFNIKGLNGYKKEGMYKDLVITF
jgi:hypothetical protein